MCADQVKQEDKVAQQPVEQPKPTPVLGPSVPQLVEQMLATMPELRQITSDVTSVVACHVMVVSRNPQPSRDAALLLMSRARWKPGGLSEQGITDAIASVYSVLESVQQVSAKQFATLTGRDLESLDLQIEMELFRQELDEQKTLTAWAQKLIEQAANVAVKLGLTAAEVVSSTPDEKESWMDKVRNRAEVAGYIKPKSRPTRIVLSEKPSWATRPILPLDNKNLKSEAEQQAFEDLTTWEEFIVPTVEAYEDNRQTWFDLQNLGYDRQAILDLRMRILELAGLQKAQSANAMANVTTDHQTVASKLEALDFVKRITDGVFTFFNPRMGARR